ncbi:MAG: SpoIIIAC/SpoIIIAD family protein [Oscillospiraceae bacterium]|nr:SpoIIIAC/SpoIIIAD family protein [Oscillospiraceae bacterium]
MEILKIAGIIIVTVILISSIPFYDKNIRNIIMIFSCIAISLYIINSFRNDFIQVKSFIETIGFGDYSILYKAMGIALVTEIVRDIAADSGNKSLSNQMIFAGKAAILLIALPVYIQVLEILTEILK